MADEATTAATDEELEQSRQLMGMMGNAQLMEEFARGKGWTDDQVAVWLSNMGNVNYVLAVGLGKEPPYPPAEPPPETPPNA